jgi:hypothetical protein
MTKNVLSKEDNYMRNTMFFKILLLFTITTVSFANKNISYDDELNILKELRAEQVITPHQFEQRFAEIQLRKPIKTTKTLGGTAVINGHIENSSGTPLESQNIQLHEIIAGEQSQVATTTTDVSGNYSFAGLNAGTYLVYQGNYDDIYLNYMWDSISNVVCSVYRGVCRDPAITNHINIIAAEIRNGIDFTPAVGGTINGSITDATSGMSVNTLYLNLVHPDSSSDYTFDAGLDVATGNFSIKGVPDGDYRLYTSDSLDGLNTHIPKIYGGPECNLCDRLMYSGAGVGTILTINAANTIDNVDLIHNVGASIAGILVDSVTLNALPNYSVLILFNELNEPLGYQIVYGTDNDPLADGSYFLGGLLPGSFYVQGDGKGFYQRELYSNKPCYYAGCYRNSGNLVTLAPLENKTGIDFILEKGGLISGTVTDTAGIPLSIPQFNEPVEFINATGNVIGAAFVNDDGTYTSAKGLPAGNYSVRTGSMFQGQLNAPYVNEKYNDVPCAGIACDLSLTNVNVVVDSITTNIDFALTQGNTFTGTVTDITTSAPIGGVHVLVYKDMGMGVVKFANWATTSRGDVPGGPAIGTFEVSGLPDGTYYARTGYGSDLPFFVSTFNNIGGIAPIGWIDILYDGMPCLADCDVTAGTAIVLPVVVNKSSSGSPSAPVIDFGLLQGVIITGQVNDFIQNAPIKEVTINVYNDQGTFMGSSITNALGEYITRGLPDGTYYLTTSTDNVLLDVKYGNEFCIQGSCNPLEAQPITVNGSINATNKNFILKTAYMHMFSNDFE